MRPNGDPGTPNYEDAWWSPTCVTYVASNALLNIGSMRAVHNGRSNALYYDGHVKSIRPGSVYQPAGWNPDPQCPNFNAKLDPGAPAGTGARAWDPDPSTPGVP